MNLFHWVTVWGHQSTWTCNHVRSGVGGGGGGGSGHLTTPDSALMIRGKFLQIISLVVINCISCTELPYWLTIIKKSFKLGNICSVEIFSSSVSVCGAGPGISRMWSGVFLAGEAGERPGVISWYDCWKSTYDIYIYILISPESSQVWRVSSYLLIEVLDKWYSCVSYQLNLSPSSSERLDY